MEKRDFLSLDEAKIKKEFLSGGFMRNTIFKLSAGIICFGIMQQAALAEFGSGSASAAPPSTQAPAMAPDSTMRGGFGSSGSSAGAPPSTTSAPAYGSNNSAPPSTTAAYGSSGSSTTPPSTTGKVKKQKHKHVVKEERHHKEKHDRLSVAVNFPGTGTSTIISYGNGRIHSHPVQPRPAFDWVGMHSGAPIPGNAVVGGGQHYPDATFFVCRAPFRGGMHPGKLFNGSCNISWGGTEVVKHHYEVLVSYQPVSWIESGHGSIPHHAIAGGSEGHRPLFICQAEYMNGMHVGKVIGRNCNFGWGGREVMLPYYNVLVG